MAVPTTNGQNQSSEMERTSWTAVQLKAAELLGQGLNRATVAKRLNGHLLKEREKRYPPVKARRVALARLRKWQQMKRFRDLQWEFAVAHLDSQSGEIVQGIARKGKMGRVDAAKLGLELAGRYTPKGHDQPTSVHISFGGMPRPQAEIVEGEVLAEEDSA